jgi:hypothetical protein
MPGACRPPGYRARVVFLTPDVPRWTPTTEADIQQAIADGILEESHWWDAKRQLNPGPKFNKAFAADLAAFAIDGGSLLIGLHEDKETGHVLPGAAADGREHLHAASAVDDARVRPAAALLIRAGLSPEQRAAVTTLLAAVAGTDPGRVSATGRRGRLRASGEQARPLEAQRRRLMTTGWLTLTELAARRSEADVAATGGWVAAQRLDRALIALEAPNGTIGVPAFQVTDDGQPRRELRPHSLCRSRIRKALRSMPAPARSGGHLGAICSRIRAAARGPWVILKGAAFHARRAVAAIALRHVPSVGPPPGQAQRRGIRAATSRPARRAASSDAIQTPALLAGDSPDPVSTSTGPGAASADHGTASGVRTPS